MTPEGHMSHEDRTIALVRTLFRIERDDGSTKIGNDYWGVGKANVGHAVNSAVSTLIKVLLELGNEAVPLSAWSEACETAKRRYLSFHEDEDGFGAGTIVDIENGLQRLIKDFGPTLRVSPQVLRNI